MMSESRVAKLAAARQKLKDHQEKKHIQPGQVENENSQIHLKTEDNSSVETTVPGTLSSIGDGYEQDKTKTDTTSNQQISEDKKFKEIDAVVQSTTNLHLQIQQQLSATEILIKEKRNLELQVCNLQQALKALENKHVDTMNNLNISKQTLYNFEIELKALKDNNNHLIQELYDRDNTIKKYESKETVHSENYNELQEKLDEIKVAFVAQKTENANLQSQLLQLHNEFDITQLKLQQLTNGATPEDCSLQGSEQIIEENHSLQQRISKLEQQLNSTEHERKQLSVHYQQYVHQLNEQLEICLTKNNHLVRVNEELSNRESNLIDHIAEMEKQLQSFRNNFQQTKQMDNTEPESEKSDYQAELHLHQHRFMELQEKYAALQNDYTATKEKLSDSLATIKHLTSKIEDLKSDEVDISKLNADITSDKIAAQLATAQNSKLKTELQDLHNTLIKMSNDKLELTEKLQAEKFLNRELTIKLSETEEKSKETLLKLMAKDDEMIRLQSNCSKMEKQIMEQMKELDKLRHYEATASVDNNVKDELIMAQKVINSLNNEITSLKFKNVDNNVSENATLKLDANSTTKFEESNMLSLEDAMIKLQQRFLTIMKEVADLSDEKQKLEHVVLQLQSETETICEYVALYQQQRGVLKQREEERTAQLKYVEEERERMVMKMESLIKIINNIASDDNLRKYFEHGSKKEDVAQILTLISDMKKSCLLKPKLNTGSGYNSFHPCPWCSGQLIDV